MKIGLEIHAELKTETKFFCSCRNEFLGSPNQYTCPICLGYPGTQPLLNRRAMEYGITTALALGMEISREGHFDRKHYAYPDLPKGYQITQVKRPLATRGRPAYNLKGDTLTIERMHLEEDTGKTRELGKGQSLIDYNRSGVPLIEIVTAPELESVKDMVEFVRYLRMLLRTLGVSDGKMEEGSLRCDLNINVVERSSGGQVREGPVMEIKNLNSFKALEKAGASEAVRLIEAMKKDIRLPRETRGYDEKTETTYPMRRKEEGEEYRYMVEPEILPYRIPKGLIHRMNGRLPEDPLRKKRRFLVQHLLSEKTVDLLAEDPVRAEFFERSNELYYAPKLTADWMVTELFRRLKGRNVSLENLPLKPEQFAELMKAVGEEEITASTGKALLDEILATGDSPERLIQQRNLQILRDRETLRTIAREILEKYPDAVEDYRRKPEKAMKFFMGKAMGRTGGNLHPPTMEDLFREMLK